MKYMIIGLMALSLSGCAEFISAPTDSDKKFDDKSEPDQARNAYKEIGIIEELNSSGCDIRRFETTESPRKNSISVDCK